MESPRRDRFASLTVVALLLLSAVSLPVLFDGGASASTGPVVSNVRVGTYPIGVAFDSSTGDLYVANYHSASVSVIDQANDSVVATVAVGSHPWGVAFDPSNGDIYVANDASDTCSVINGSTDLVVATVPVGELPIGVVYDPANGDIYVVNDNSNTTSVIDGATNAVVTTVAVGFWPYAAAYDPSNGDVYVTNIGAGTVSVISSSNNVVVATIGTGNPYSYPEGIAFDSLNGYMYLVEDGLNAVSIINGSNIVGTVRVGTYPEWVAFDPVLGDLIVTNTGSATVSVIAGSSNTVVRTLRVGKRPYGVAFDPDNGKVYVADVGSGTVSAITPDWVTQAIQLTMAGSGPAARVLLAGCSVSSSSMTANGAAQTFTAAPNCRIVIYFPRSSTSRYVSSAGATELSIRTCASGTCPTSSITVYHQFYVAFVASGPGTVSPRAGWFDDGSSVALTATPNAGHQFEGWSSNSPSLTVASPDSATTTALVDGAGRVTASFV